MLVAGASEPEGAVIADTATEVERAVAGVDDGEEGATGLATEAAA